MSSKPLSQPLQFGDLTLQNRIALAPLTRGRADDHNVPTEQMALYYVQRASAGLLITEGTFVSEEARGWLNAPGIWNAAQVAAWKKIVAAVKAQNPKAVFFMQLWHTGRASHRSFQPDNQPPRSASSIAVGGSQRGGKQQLSEQKAVEESIAEAATGSAPEITGANGYSGVFRINHIHTKDGKKPYEAPREMTHEDIKRTVQDFANAARNAKEAGFDGVELHSANGYLIDNFLQSRTNQRTDEYGGSVENRTRFLLEVVDAVATVYPPSRIISRLSPNNVFNDMGSEDYREQFTYAATALNGKVGTIEIMDGVDIGFHGYGERFTARDVRNVFKGHVFCNCGHTFASAEELVTKGDTDVVAFGRPFIVTPDLVERYESGAALNDEPNSFLTWYVGTAHGYTDYKDLRVPAPRLQDNFNN